MIVPAFPRWLPLLVLLAAAAAMVSASILPPGLQTFLPLLGALVLVAVVVVHALARRLRAVRRGKAAVVARGHRRASLRAADEPPPWADTQPCVHLDPSLPQQGVSGG